MTSPAQMPAQATTQVPASGPAGLSLVEALVAESTTVVDLALLERLYLDLTEV